MEKMSKKNLIIIILLMLVSGLLIYYLYLRPEAFVDPTTTTLRVSDGTTPGGNEVGGSSYNSSQFIDYGPYSGGGPVPINLTKKYHWLVDLGVGNYYTLADGEDGQELTFLASFGLNYGGVEQSDIYVDNAKFWDDAGVNARWKTGGRIIRCFSHDNTNDVRGMVKALWMNGAWQFTGGEDHGGLP